MTRKDLEDLRPLKAEIESIKEEIRNLKVTTDSVTGSLPEHPWTEQHIKIQGVDQGQYVRLVAKLHIKIDERQGKIAQIEEWLESIDDAEMRAIMRLRYVEGLSWQKISNRMGNQGDGSTERKKSNIFLEKI